MQVTSLLSREESEHHHDHDHDKEGCSSCGHDHEHSSVHLWQLLVLAIVYAREPEHPSHFITEKPLAAPHG